MAVNKFDELSLIKFQNWDVKCNQVQDWHVEFDSVCNQVELSRIKFWWVELSRIKFWWV